MASVRDSLANRIQPLPFVSGRHEKQVHRTLEHGRSSKIGPKGPKVRLRQSEYK